MRLLKSRLHLLKTARSLGSHCLLALFSFAFTGFTLLGLSAAPDRESKDDAAAATASAGENPLAGRGPDDPSYAEEKPTAEVRDAIRQILSSNPQVQRQGRKRLDLLGGAVIPQLRYWLRSVRGKTATVEEVLAEIGGDSGEGAQPGPEVDSFLRYKLLEAQHLARESDYRKAMTLGNAILVLDENRPESWLIRRFVRDCQERLAAKELLEPSFHVTRQVYEVGETPEITFRLTNHKNSETVVFLEKGVLGEAAVALRQSFINAEWKISGLRLTVRADAAPQGRIVLGPGKSWERTVSLQLDQPLPLSGAVARVVVSGRFRPTRWTADDPNDNLSLSMPETEFWIVPPGQAPLSHRPLEKMTAALLFQKDEAFFVGGQLAVWAGEHDSYYNGKVIETLINRLDTLKDQRLKQAVWFLNQATGENISTDLKAWKKWWKKIRPLEADDEATAEELAEESRGKSEKGTTEVEVVD